ncbi:MAG: glycosyltransferase [Hyphomicrobiales bacterium]|nr:MAG: glycosyltransferase [Hyphomicrobiales bacterium]
MSELPVILILVNAKSPTGAFVAVRNIATVMKRQANIAIVVPEDSLLTKEDLAVFWKVIKVPLIDLSRDITKAPFYFFQLIRAAFVIKKWAAELSAKAVQINDFYLMHGAALRLLGYRGRIITWVRIHPRNYAGLAAPILMRFATLASDEMVVVSRFIREASGLEGNSTLIYDAYPRDAMPQLSSFSSIDPPRIVQIANYMEGKGQRLALCAFLKIARTVPTAEMHFYGSTLGNAKNDSFLESLKTMCISSGFQDRIFFHAFSRDFSEMLSGAIVALTLSESESFSMTTLEAGLAGVAVIATRCGGPEEIISPGETGLLIHVGDVESLAEKILYLLEHPEYAKSLGQKAKCTYPKRFSVERFREKLASSYRL